MMSTFESLSEIRENVRISDLVLMLFVPAILSLVFLLPQSVQNALILDYGSPQLFNLWSAAFVHRGFAHFSNNLINYVIISILAYFLLVLAEEKSLFRYFFFFTLLLLPPLLALINILVLRQGTGAGFSGVGSAFLGFLPVSLVLFVHKRISEKIVPSDSVVFFLIIGGVTAWIYTDVVTAVGIFLLSTIPPLFIIRRIGVGDLREITSEIISMDHFWLVLFAGVLSLLSPILLFPQNIVRGDSAVNILSHYGGLVIGFFGPTIYLYFRYESQKTTETGIFR